MRYVTRDQWGAKPPKYRNVMPRPVSLAVIHHKGQTDGSGNYAPANPDPYRDMREIQSYHMDRKKWSDGAYQECVATVPGYDGWVFEGRGFGYIGGATGNPPGDARSLSICVLDNCNGYVPSPAVLESIAQRLAYAVKIGRLSESFRLTGDKDWNQTACPGKHLYSQLGAIRRRVSLIVAGNEPTPAPIEPPEDEEMKWLYFHDTSSGTEFVVTNSGDVREYGPAALRELREAGVIGAAPKKVPAEVARDFRSGDR